MLLGLGIPTCREGVAYAPGFASVHEIVEMALAAAESGYDAVWGNQHLITQSAIAATAATPPNYYDPMVIMSFIAAAVPDIQLVFGTLVAPAHHPLMLAKQLATLDQLSRGRVVVGLGLGAYVEETAMLGRPGAGPRHRGRTFDELISSLRLLFTEHSATFHGTEFEFENVQSYPKPTDELRILSSGDSDAGIERAARLADGWIVASRSPEDIVAKQHLMSAALDRHGRVGVELQLAAQAWVCLGDDEPDAERRLVNTQHFRRLQHMTDKPVSVLLDEFRGRNLLGPLDVIAKRIDEYDQVGVDHLSLIFLGDSADEVTHHARRLRSHVAAGQQI
jgi:alkanesulfonate monooxygenase SsuD/methylene tetrahydromethanopterin reductase-like flavin-dependent oxidoreductase (luciferase family)